MTFNLTSPCPLYQREKKDLSNLNKTSLLMSKSLKDKSLCPCTWTATSSNFSTNPKTSVGPDLCPWALNDDSILVVSTRKWCIHQSDRRPDISDPQPYDALANNTGLSKQHSNANYEKHHTGMYFSLLYFIYMLTLKQTLDRTDLQRSPYRLFWVKPLKKPFVIPL